MRSLVWALLFLCAPCGVIAEDFRFSHQVSLNPIAPLQSVMTFVSEGGEQYKSVRALLILDGELLAVPLLPANEGNAYRGTFPTPKESFSYQFQAVSNTDAAKLSNSFEVSPFCSKGEYLPQRAVDPEIRRALLAQQQRQRLFQARDLLRKYLQKLGAGE